MKKLLNTLYVTSENSYLGLDGENEKVNQIDAYGMVDNQIVSHVLPHGMIENTKQNRLKSWFLY